MLIEQVIEFELKGLEPLDRIVVLLQQFQVKAKISTENLRVDYCLLQKYLQNFTSK